MPPITCIEEVCLYFATKPDFVVGDIAVGIMEGKGKVKLNK